MADQWSEALAVLRAKHAKRAAAADEAQTASELERLRANHEAARVAMEDAKAAYEREAAEVSRLRKRKRELSGRDDEDEEEASEGPTQPEPASRPGLRRRTR